MYQSPIPWLIMTLSIRGQKEVVDVTKFLEVEKSFGPLWRSTSARLIGGTGSKAGLLIWTTRRIGSAVLELSFEF